MKTVSTILGAFALAMSLAAMPVAAQEAQSRNDQASARAEMQAGRNMPIRDIERRIIPRMEADDEYIGFEYDETAQAYRPALTLAIGLAALDTDRKAERAEFLPGSVRRRRQFLSKSLFLYMAAALVIAVVLPLYILSSNSAAEADDYLKRQQQGPLGRYPSASSEIAIHQKAQERVQKRAEATLTATGPGRVATQVLLAFARVRPESVRMRSVELITDTSNPEKAKDFIPVSKLEVKFFIESLPGADPTQVSVRLRETLKGLKGVGKVTPGPVTENPSAQGMDVTYIVELDIHAQEANQ